MFSPSKISALGYTALVFFACAGSVNGRLQRRSRFDELNQNTFDESVFENRTRRSSCASPPLRATVNFPESLVGTCNINYEMHSGYIPVTSTDFLFYWHFGPKEASTADAPVIFWTNGGPGCSSMEGIFLATCTLFSQICLCMFDWDAKFSLGSSAQHFIDAYTAIVAVIVHCRL